MAVWTELNLTQLADLRLDADYYQPRYLKLDNELDKLDPVKTGDIAYVTDGIHGSPDVVEEGGIRYLSAKCVKDNYFVLDDSLQISKAQDAKNPRTRPKVEDILLTTVGTIGNAAVVTPEVLPANTDRHLGLIRLRSGGDFDPYFVSTFLNSEYGRFQTLRESTGNVQLNLFIYKIKSLKVPALKCAHVVAEMTRSAYAKKKESESLYVSAQQIMLSELGLDSLDLSSVLSYKRPYSEAVATHRLDAEYYRPRYYQLMKSLKKAAKAKTSARLSSISSPLRYGTSDKLSYTETGVPFLRLTDLENRRFDLATVLRISSKEAVEQEAAVARARDVLVSRSGTLGVAVAIPDELQGAIFGSYFIRVRPDSTKVHPDFLALYINSFCGSLQVERLNTGTVQTNLTIPAIESIYVVFGDLEWQEIFVKKVHESVHALQESKRLIKDAKRIVEESVRKGGK